jgi:hypothetical protein
MTMLGVKGTTVYHGDAPLTDGPPYHRLDGNPEGSSPMVLARRRASAVTFSALHEPYEKRAAIRGVSRIQETDEAVGLVVEGEGFSDRVLIAFDADKDHTLRNEAEAFTFRGHGYLRRTDRGIVVRGQVKGFRLRAGKADKLTVNGKEEAGRRDGEFLLFGEAPAVGPRSRALRTTRSSGRRSITPSCPRRRTSRRADRRRSPCTSAASATARRRGGSC